MNGRDDELLPQQGEFESDQTDDDLLVSEQPTVDASSKQSLRKQSAKQLQDAAEIESFWKVTLGSPIGRREIWKLINDEHHAFTPVFAGVGGLPDKNAQWYHRGIQDIGLRFYHALFAVDPNGILLMHQENDIRFAKPQPKRKRRSDG